MKKKIIFLGLTLMLLLTGCGSNKDRVVIYSSMEEERNQDLKKMVKEEFPDMDVVVQYMATGNCAAKIKNEGTKVEADIVLDLETAHMKDVKDNFADLSDFDTSIYLDGVNNDSNYLTWTKYTMNLIIDNKYFKVIESDYGTKVYAFPYYDGTSLLDLKNVLYFWYDPILLEFQNIKKVLNNDLSNIPCSKIFLDKKTVYKVGDLDA